jgi:hypothetical protein
MQRNIRLKAIRKAEPDLDRLVSGFLLLVQELAQRGELPGSPSKDDESGEAA